MHATKAVLLFTGFYGLVSFQKPPIEYDFNISAHRVGKVPQNIRVRFINHSNVALNFSNLVLTFYVDDEGFWGTWEKVRFLKKDLQLAPKQGFNMSIPFDSLAIVSFKGERAFPNSELQYKIQRCKKMKIKASMSDWRRLENPLESSSLIWSNLIEF
jgi:hypothetical protein